MNVTPRIGASYSRSRSRRLRTEDAAEIVAWGRPRGGFSTPTNAENTYQPNQSLYSGEFQDIDSDREDGCSEDNFPLGSSSLYNSRRGKTIYFIYFLTQ